MLWAPYTCDTSAAESSCPSPEASGSPAAEGRSLTPSSDVSGTGPHTPTTPTTSPKVSAGRPRCRIQSALPGQTRLFIQASQLVALMFIPTLKLNDGASWESSPDVCDGRGEAPGRQTAGSSAAGGQGSWVWLGPLCAF